MYKASNQKGKSTERNCSLFSDRFYLHSALQEALQSSAYQEQREAQFPYLSQQVLLLAGVIPGPDYQILNINNLTTENFIKGVGAWKGT